MLLSARSWGAPSTDRTQPPASSRARLCPVPLDRLEATLLAPVGVGQPSEGPSRTAPGGPRARRGSSVACARVPPTPAPSLPLFLGWNEEASCGRSVHSSFPVASADTLPRRAAPMHRLLCGLVPGRFRSITPTSTTAVVRQTPVRQARGSRPRGPLVRPAGAGSVSRPRHSAGNGPGEWTWGLGACQLQSQHSVGAAWLRTPDCSLPGRPHPDVGAGAPRTGSFSGWEGHTRRRWWHLVLTVQSAILESSWGGEAGVCV